jgi:hypothetical protein
MLQRQNDHNNQANENFSEAHNADDRLPIYSKPYYYLRRAWESTQIYLANVVLALKSVLLRLTRINKRTK